jgi:predicted helicase
LTGYSKDRGIDVFLQKGNEVIGVQVKRTKRAIGVEQIVHLAGALVLNSCTRGVFVTTSRFTKDAERTSKEYASKLHTLPIELINSEQFFDALSIAQRERYQSIDEIYLSHIRYNLDEIELHNFWDEVFDGMFDDMFRFDIRATNSIKDLWRRWFRKS